MNQTCSYQVVVKNSAKDVIVPLNGCICSLNRVSKALVVADVHPITRHCSNYDFIRQQIVQAWRSLQHSDQASTACLRCLDESLERLKQDEGRLEGKKNATKHTLDNLRTKQASNQKLLEESLGALEQAETNLSSTRDTLESQERRVQDAKVLTGVGLGLSVIPFFGWVAAACKTKPRPDCIWHLGDIKNGDSIHGVEDSGKGPILVIGGAVQMAKASQAIEIAEEEMRTFKQQVDEYTDEVNDYMIEISKTTSYISVMDHALVQIRDDIRAMKKHRQLVSELQGKTRKAVHLLSVLGGQVNVFELQTRRFILRESVMEVMEEVMNSAEAISENELLCNEGMVRLVDKLRRNIRHLRAVRASRNSDEDESFLLKYM